jgi:hypothetical protein
MDIQPGEDERNLQAVTTKGFNLQAGLSPLTAEVIAHLDGSTRLRAAIQKTGQEEDDNPTLLLEIQALLGLGMLALCPAR